MAADALCEAPGESRDAPEHAGTRYGVATDDERIAAALGRPSPTGSPSSATTGMTTRTRDDLNATSAAARCSTG